MLVLILIPLLCIGAVMILGLLFLIIRYPRKLLYAGLLIGGLVLLTTAWRHTEFSMHHRLNRDFNAADLPRIPDSARVLKYDRTSDSPIMGDMEWINFDLSAPAVDLRNWLAQDNKFEEAVYHVEAEGEKHYIRSAGQRPEVHIFFNEQNGRVHGGFVFFYSSL